MSITSARTSKTQLLYIGNEPDLSKASSALLKQAGFKVRSTNPLHAADAVREHRYSAVIFCATLSFSEMEKIARLMEIHQPGVPIISVRVGMLGDGPCPTSAMVVDALCGPQALIGAVRTVIAGPESVMRAG
ncbi:MAG TPA: hypothetical protein VG897_13705 [Terriglobales bacterium]|nr:hypothetical protein [Terriglobales bacterium]